MCVILTFGASGILALQAHAAINYPDFSSTSGLVMLNDTAQVGSLLRVAPAVQYKFGQAWYNQRQDVTNAFSTTFQFSMNNPDSFFGGADGLVFVIQNDSLSAAGNNSLGEYLGYHGIPNSIAVEFDAFDNPSDPNDNHISIHTRGTLANDTDETFSIGSTGTGLAINLNDAAVHTAKISYVPGTMNVYLDNMITPVLTASVNIPSTLSLTSGGAYVGFTSATATGYENHDVLNWTFNAVPEPSTIGLAIIGMASLLVPRGLGMLRRCRRAGH